MAVPRSHLSCRRRSTASAYVSRSPRSRLVKNRAVSAPSRAAPSWKPSANGCLHAGSDPQRPAPLRALICREDARSVAARVGCLGDELRELDLARMEQVARLLAALHVPLIRLVDQIGTPLQMLGP